MSILFNICVSDRAFLRWTRNSVHYTSAEGRGYRMFCWMLRPVCQCWISSGGLPQEKIDWNDTVPEACTGIQDLQGQFCNVKKIWSFQWKSWWDFVLINQPNEHFSVKDADQELVFVDIHFDSLTYEKVVLDRKLTFEAQLSLVGGTMGLLTGFSIMSAVEILYYLFKFLLSLRHQLPQPESWKRILG